MMKKVVSLLLIVILMICSVPFIVSADETEIYKSVSVEYSDNRGKTEKLDVMIKNQNVYVEAAKMSERLGFICRVSDEFINIKNNTNINLPASSTVIFNANNTQVKKLVLSKFIDTYEAPFPSIINDKGTWIPFEYSLLMLNSGLLIVNNCILIDIPQKNIIDCFTDALFNDSTYCFEWSKDLGYSDWDENISVASNHLVNVFSGLLDFDGYSWAELFQALLFDSTSYDSKYGKDLALFLCTEADEELNATIEQMNFVDELLDGNLGLALNIQSTSINGSVENLYNQCNNLLTEIKSGNTSSVSMYNRTYKEFEKALNKQTWFSKTGDKILQIQDGLSGAAKALRAISIMGEVASYGAEFNNQDEFSLSALKAFLSNSSTSSDLPKAMKQSMNDYSELLSTDLITYSATRTFEENIDTLITGDGTIAEALGAQACMALFVWNIASNMIPFISNGLDAADKFELAEYTQVFQADAQMNYIQKRDSILYNEEKLTPDNLYSLSQYLYVYLKSCYVARNAAIASLNGKRNSTKEKLQPLIDAQNRINAQIARILNILKNANKTNEDNVYGFLPADNKKYLDNYSDNNLVSFLESNGGSSSSENITAMDLIDKSLAEIVELMGNDYQLNKQQFSTAFGSDPVLMIYNETTMPGLAVCPSYDSGIYKDIVDGINAREKIQQGSYTYDGIAVFGNGKLNETISADMTYNQIAEQIGDFDCRGVGQETLVYSTEMNGIRVSFFFTSYDNPDLSARIKNNTVSSADMKTVNPKLKSIAIYNVKKNSSETGFSTNTGWKKAYRDYISEHYTSYNRFALIYVDNDDVPELKVSQELYVYSGNEVKWIRVGNSFVYKERSGEYAVSSLHQGYGGFTVYQLNNGDPTKIFGGSVNYNKDEYTINGENVDAATYKRIGDEWFEKYDSQYQTMTKDEVFKLLSE